MPGSRQTRTPTEPRRLERPLASSRALLQRARLLEILAGRFDRRLTLIVAGAGFGKTSLLLQAMEQNELEPRGTDLWLSCRPEDGFASQLVRCLGRLTGARPRAAREGHAIAEAVWQRSPEQIALILDDTHEIAAESASWPLIETLLAELPSNGHLVLASRSAPPIATSRLLAQGHAVELSEAELAFDAEERAAFARLRGIDAAALRDAGGWPAVLELSAGVGRARVPEFLWDEVLAGLDDERRRTLARLSFLDSVDDALAREVAGVESVQAVFEDLPLTTFDRSGAARMHAMWRPVLDRYEEAHDPEARRRAAFALKARNQLAEAIELGLQIDDDHRSLAELVDTIAKESWIAIPADVLDGVLQRLPETLLESASGQLLLGAHHLSSDARRADGALQRAAASFAKDADAVGELQAIAALSHLAFWRNDEARSREYLRRFETLADRFGGSPQSVAWPRAMVAVVEGRPQDAIALIDRAREPGAELSAEAATLLSIAGLDAGLPDRVIREVTDALPSAPPRFAGPLAALRLEAEWLSGGATPQALDAAAAFVARNVERISQNMPQSFGSLAHTSASLGRFEDAERFLAAANQARPRAIGERAAVGIAIAQAALLMGTGDEAAAAEALRAMLREHPVGDRPLRAHLRGLPLVYLLCPEQRAALDALELGPTFAEARDVGRGLAELRLAGRTEGAAALDWSQPRRIGALIVPCLRDELAVAAVAAGVDAAEAALRDGAGDPRPTLRRLAERENAELHTAARRLLVSLPVRPPYSLEIRVLGPLALLRDGFALEDGSLRRERVREMLQYLVAHRRTTREAVAAALWPEQNEESVRNNLRVNLAHLQKLLEPERRSKEPAWFLRSDGDVLLLDGADQLDIDAERFDAACAAAEAADQAGIPATALAHHLAAVALYGGDYMADLPDAVWAEFDRTRLRSRFVRAAVRAGELSLAKGETARVLELGRHALRVEDLCEPAHRLVALAFRADGDVAAARRSLRALLDLLDREQLEPESDTLRLAATLGMRSADG